MTVRPSPPALKVDERHAVATRMATPKRTGSAIAQRGRRQSRRNTKLARTSHQSDQTGVLSGNDWMPSGRAEVSRTGSKNSARQLRPESEYDQSAVTSGSRDAERSPAAMLTR